MHTHFSLFLCSLFLGLAYDLIRKQVCVKQWGYLVLISLSLLFFLEEKLPFPVEKVIPFTHKQDPKAVVGNTVQYIQSCPKGGWFNGKFNGQSSESVDYLYCFWSTFTCYFMFYSDFTSLTFLSYEWGKLHMFLHDLIDSLSMHGSCQNSLQCIIKSCHNTAPDSTEPEKQGSIDWVEKV